MNLVMKLNSLFDIEEAIEVVQDKEEDLVFRAPVRCYGSRRSR
jgi:hypothetical protein